MKLIWLYQCPRPYLFLVNQKISLSCSWEAEIQTQSQLPSCSPTPTHLKTGKRKSLLPLPMCACLPESSRPANHNEGRTEWEHPRSAQDWNVFFSQLLWRKHVGQLTSSLQKRPLSPYGENGGNKTGFSQINCLQSGSGHQRLEWNIAGEQNRGFWPGKLLQCDRNRNLFLFLFFPLVFNASCALFIPLCSPYILRNIPFENAHLPVVCYGENKKKNSFFHKQTAIVFLKVIHITLGQERTVTISCK